jgi:hypothetical protein
MSLPGPSRTQRDLRFRSAVEVLSGPDMLTQRFSGSDPDRSSLALPLITNGDPRRVPL